MFQNGLFQNVSFLHDERCNGKASEILSLAVFVLSDLLSFFS